MAKQTHDLSLAKLGTATGQSSSGDRSLKDANSAHNYKGGSVSMKHFLVSKVNLSESGSFAPIPGASKIVSYYDNYWYPVYYGGAKSGRIAVLFNTHSGYAQAKLYNETGTLLATKTGTNGRWVYFDNLDGSDDFGYEMYRLELRDSSSGTSQSIWVYVQQADFGPGGVHKRPEKYRTSLPYITAKKMASEGIVIPYNTTTKIIANFSDQNSRFDNIREEEDNYIWWASSGLPATISKVNNGANVTNVEKRPARYKSGYLYMKFKDSDFNDKDIVTNYNKTLSVKVRMPGPDKHGMRIRSTPETRQQTSLPYANVNNGTISIRAIAGHLPASTSFNVYIYSGSSLKASWTGVARTTTVTKTGLTSGSYKVLVVDASLASAGISSSLWGSITVSYGGGGNTANYWPYGTTDRTIR